MAPARGPAVLLLASFLAAGAGASPLLYLLSQSAGSSAQLRSIGLPGTDSVLVGGINGLVPCSAITIGRNKTTTVGGTPVTVFEPLFDTFRDIATDPSGLVFTLGQDVTGSSSLLRSIDLTPGASTVVAGASATIGQVVTPSVFGIPSTFFDALGEEFRALAYVDPASPGGGGMGGPGGETVPEPDSIVLFLAGCLVLGTVRRRRMARR